MKSPSLKRRLITLALLLLTLIALTAPVVARHATTAVDGPDKVAVNWNSRLPAPTPTPTPVAPRP